MLDIADELTRWRAAGRDFAAATVVAVSGSAPREVGAALAVDADGAAVGSVSGGCVEGAVYELCQRALETGRGTVERFGYSDDDAFAVGLTCGGVIDVLVTPVRGGGLSGRAGDAGSGDAGPGDAGPGGRAAGEASATVAAALDAAARGRAAALVRVVTGPAEFVGGALLVRPGGGYTGSLGGDPALDRTAAAEAAALLDAGRTDTRTIGATGERCGEPVTVLVESSVPAPRMIIFGAVDFASALVRVGGFLGYHVSVCDARPVFATPERFPEADEVVADWPHRYLDAQVTRSARAAGTEPGGAHAGEGANEGRAGGGIDGRTVLCVLTHDAKFDIPLLERALRLPVGYVGAMGSRRTHLDRLRRLRAAGLTERELSRLRSPIGLDLGARTPEETALSIAAEIVADRRGGTGTPLTGAHTPIHHAPPPPRT
ncbi:XdhC family protein [Streptomyces sp. 71268]|uniref:XdhC family protein n=1 Tax=Streptomyces sp. 71268 TaxID=3002640 RepID=UPI0023F9430C|nr:XdhC/CoxI family protein [Streptomyces sp. 71268]WEV24780.1 XdhC family protein [Streptomyces sp. 71268]